MGGPLHLSRRFFGSLRTDPPSSHDVSWVAAQLGDGEMSIWSAMSHPDQRHAVDVARKVDGEVQDRDGDIDDGSYGRDWSEIEGWFDSIEHRRRVMVRAALMHDSGKNASDLGTFSRVGATLLRPLVGGDLRRKWRHGGGVAGRLGRYWHHPEIGAEALQDADSHPFVISWAAQHHQPPERWSIPKTLGLILRDCDDD